MRISDWSSDVCSSDLPRSGAGFDADFIGLDLLGRDRRTAVWRGIRGIETTALEALAVGEIKVRIVDDLIEHREARRDAVEGPTVLEIKVGRGETKWYYRSSIDPLLSAVSYTGNQAEADRKSTRLNSSP